MFSTWTIVNYLSLTELLNKAVERPWVFSCHYGIYVLVVTRWFCAISAPRTACDEISLHSMEGDGYRKIGTSKALKLFTPVSLSFLQLFPTTKHSLCS